MEMHRVLVAGGTGRTGKAVVRYLTQRSDLQVVGVVSRTYAGRNMSELIPEIPYEIPVFDRAERAVGVVKPTILVDFTTPETAMRHFLLCIDHRIHPIIGTTGFTASDKQFIADMCRVNELGGALIANFALGIAIMQQALALAAEVFNHAVVIDYYSDQKREVPSGTSQQLSEFLAQFDNYKTKPVPIYSFRIPGQHVSQQVKFGGFGETLTIIHEVSDRICFGPGVAQAILNIHRFNCLVTDLRVLL